MRIFCYGVLVTIFGNIPVAMFPRLIILIYLFSGPFWTVIGQNSNRNALKIKVAEASRATTGQVGVGIMHLKSRDTLLINGAVKFPMQSVYKFPLALAVLHQVDIGKLSLSQKILVTKDDIHPEIWGPLRHDHGSGDFYVTIEELLKYTVSMSDNNACDVLFRLAGGTKAVDQYIKELDIKGIAITTTEKEMQRNPQVQFTNWCTPTAMLDLLVGFYERDILSPSSRQFLWKIMVETITGPDRIPGQLPSGTEVAHKTGTSASTNGITAAYNDVGIVRLPTGDHFAIVVFITNASEEHEVLSSIISELTMAAWNHYQH